MLIFDTFFKVTVLAKAARKKENEALVLNTAMFLFLHGHFRVLKKNKKEILVSINPFLIFSKFQ